MKLTLHKQTIFKLNNTLYIYFAITLTTLILVIQQADASTQRNAQEPASRRQLMVAIHCSSEQEQRSGKVPALYHNQYYDLESRAWISDHDAAAYCTEDKQEILKYCRRVYPGHDIKNIVEASHQFKIDNWCRLGSKKRCRTKLTVRPFRCLEGSFQSDALLVPEKCVFDHVHNKSTCDVFHQWNRTATNSCQQKDMLLQSFAVLNPCGLGMFSGVEFVCCPTQKQRKSVITAKTLPDSKQLKEDDDEKFNEVSSSNESHKKINHGQDVPSAEDDEDDDSNDDSNEDDDNEDDEETDEDDFDDDSSSWNGSKEKSTSTTTSSTTTTTTTTTTTERPIDYYLSHFDLAHEHDDFRRAELAVENSYREKITHVMKEWSELESRYREMKKKNPEAAEDFKKKMAQRFEKTVEALEEESAAERRQLISMHSERAMTIINRRKKAAMDCLTQALDRTPITTKQVEKCIVHLLKALEKDRVHTLRQYKNLLNLNTREALREKNTILEHLVTLNRAANQSIAMLDRSPSLSSKLKNKVITLWHNLRNIPIDEPILRESELKIMERYEEEVAQRKIEKERKRLLEQDVILDPPQESSKSKEDSKESQAVNKDIKHQTSLEKNEKAPEVQRPVQIESKTLPVAEQITHQPEKYKDSHQASNGQQNAENEIHYQLNDAKYSHIKADAPHHELSYSIKHEASPNQLSVGYSTFLILACTAIVIVVLIGVKYYTRNVTRVQKRRLGFTEVGRMDPEEKNVTNMQVNGYENPAYKFLEAEA